MFVQKYTLCKKGLQLAHNNQSVQEPAVFLSIMFKLMTIMQKSMKITHSIIWCLQLKNLYTILWFLILANDKSSHQRGFPGFPPIHSLVKCIRVKSWALTVNRVGSRLVRDPLPTKQSHVFGETKFWLISLQVILWHYSISSLRSEKLNKGLYTAKP